MEDKLPRDRDGEIYQDELTENESMPSPARREDANEDLQLDSQVDSQEDDEAMAENRFGVNKPNDENNTGSRRDAGR
jgi:hypothetical protein